MEYVNEIILIVGTFVLLYVLVKTIKLEFCNKSKK